ncbi:TPA: Ig-like domain repeat protein [Escherichia coli]|nr:Ig-like domain repeat protein [Escherichia coli]
MYHTYSKNSVKGAGIPDSNLDEDFTAKVVIYDNAGNTRTLPLQLFRYDNYLGGPRSAKLRKAPPAWCQGFPDIRPIQLG